MIFIFLTLDNMAKKMLSQITGWFLGNLKLSQLISSAGLNTSGEHHPKIQRAANWQIKQH